MATNALGPTMAGGMQPIIKDGYELMYLPDVNNDALQREGKAPVFYWLPNQVAIARKGGRDDGDFLFNLIRFAGVQSADTHVGAQSNREVAGGVLTFTVTGAPPDHVLKQSQDQIIEQHRASGDYFWGIRTNVAPVFRPMIITSNTTSISNVSPLAHGGGVPALTPAGSGGGPAPSGPAPAGPTPAGPAPAGPDGGGPPRAMIRASYSPPRLLMPRTVPANRDPSADSNLNPWYWNMFGQGAGSIDPMGTNAFSALLGAYPTQIMWSAFHGTASPVVVVQNYKLKMWAPMVEIRIDGKWKRIFEHFSAAASARYLWFKADIQAELNKMRVNGDITVNILVDPTIPGADKIQETIDKRTDLVFDKFMAEAQKVIFEPPQPQVQAAQASSGGGGIFPWGVGVSLKYRRDETTLELHYHEKRQMAFLQDHTVSSSLSGMYEEMKKDPTAEKKYFLNVFMDDWPRKLGRIVKPVVNWKTDPVAFVAAQVGYPDTAGALMWTGHTFQKTDPEDATWKIGITQKPESEVASPPAGWKPDHTFVKRTLHFREPDTSDPFVRVQVDKNVIELDPGPNGTPLNDVTLEVRADSAGKLDVGPVSLGVELETSKQRVEVTFEPTDDKGQSLNREPVKFQWGHDDQNQSRYWSVFTGDPSFRPFYRYKVRVIIKGSLTSKGEEWEGPWVEANGNGPLTVRVPMADDPGVQKRNLPSFLDQARTLASAQARAIEIGQDMVGRPRSDPGFVGVRDLDIRGWSLADPVGSRDMVPPPGDADGGNGSHHGSGAAAQGRPPAEAVAPPPGDETGPAEAPPPGSTPPPGDVDTATRGAGAGGAGMRELEVVGWRAGD